MKDKYDKAVEHLTENPENIGSAWLNPAGEGQGGCLFTVVAPLDVKADPWPKRPDGRKCGCLTTIRNAGKVPYIDGGGSPHKMPALAWTDDLTERIQADERLPKLPTEITVQHLPIFAEWQRRIDKELNREP